MMEVTHDKALADLEELRWEYRSALLEMYPDPTLIARLEDKIHHLEERLGLVESGGPDPIFG